jgi:zinc finger protein 830
VHEELFQHVRDPNQLKLSLVSLLENVVLVTFHEPTSIVYSLNHGEMADVRALLKAKRQEARISHPLASYNSAGALRCLACDTTLKQSAAWNGHLGSKSHRVNVSRLREEEARREEEERLARKRKATPETANFDAESLPPNDDDEGSESDPADSATQKKRKTDAQGTFPNDFFSDPDRALPTPMDDDSDQEDAQVPAPAVDPSSTADPEWEAFQRYINAPSMKESDERETFDRATVFAEPELVPEAQGMPNNSTTDAAASPPAVSEEDVQRVREQEERELIMDRLMEEERAQEEADAKVTSLKARLDYIRQRRDAARHRK